METDHKGLIYLLNQKNVSGCQARWLEKISSFIFQVEYTASNENVLADALSRMYSNDDPATIRARSEYTLFDIVNDDAANLNMVVLARINAVISTHWDSSKGIPPGAETGRPETSREFASCMKNRFVLRGPKDRTEGRLENGKQLTTPLTPDNVRDQSNKDKKDVNQEDIDPDDRSNQDQTPEIDHTLINVLKNNTGLDLLKINKRTLSR
jgi:hypothetical protein